VTILVVAFAGLVRAVAMIAVAMFLAIATIAYGIGFLMERAKASIRKSLPQTTQVSHRLNVVENPKL